MPKPHVVVAGTGRAGTTALMRLFTELDLETGFSKTDYAKLIDPISLGGLEFDLENADYENLPRFIKSPYFYKYADKVLNDDNVFIEHILVPVRMLDQATKSRIRIHLPHIEISSGKFYADTVPGGLTGTNTLEDQEVILGRQLTSLIKSISKSFTQHTFLAFPTFAQDPKYLFKSINFLLPNTSYEVFFEAFQSVIDVDLIHSFD